MNRIKQAVAFFNSGFVCSQAILATYGPEYGLSKQLALTLASGFAGGIAGTAKTCGAVAGAVMVIGLAKGHADPEDKAAKQAAYAAVRDFLQGFKRRHGTTQCKQLLGHDIGTPHGHKAAQESGVFKTQCPVFVESAAVELDRVLDVA